MRKLLRSIDSLICKYLGFDKQDIIPQTLKKIGKKIVLTNTESFKRHLYSQKLDDFFSSNLNSLSNTTKQKLGISVGKALANDLVISFESITIEENSHA